MRKKNKVVKGIFIVLLVAVVTALLSVLQYAVYYIDHPMRRESGLAGTGCLMWGNGEDEYAMVSVLVEGNELHYLYQNNWGGEEIISLSVNDFALIPKDEVYGSTVWNTYPNDQPGGGGAWLNEGNEELWGFIYTTRNMKSLICGINDVSLTMDSLSDLQGKKAVLAVPADNRAEAEELIEKALSDGNDMGLKDWLVKAIFEGVRE